MRRPLLLAAWLAAVLLSLLGSATALGHGGGGDEGLRVEPSTVTAGGSVVLAATGLEPDSDRSIELVGPDLVVELGTAATGADGMFSKEVTIPSHLPGGEYTFEVIGDETLTVPLAVMAAAAGAGAPPTNDAAEILLPRSRSALELALLVGMVAVLVLSGGLLVWRAERIRGASEPGVADRRIPFAP